MTANDAANLAPALLLVAALAVAGSFAFLTGHDRCAVAATTGRGLATSAFYGWNLTINALLTVWVLASWRRLTRNLGLAYTDKHAMPPGYPYPFPTFPCTWRWRACSARHAGGVNSRQPGRCCSAATNGPTTSIST